MKMRQLEILNKGIRLAVIVGTVSVYFRHESKPRIQSSTLTLHMEPDMLRHIKISTSGRNGD